MWPDTIAATGMLSSPRTLRTIEKACRFAYRRASVITVLSPGFRDLLIERGVPAGKIRVVYNWTEETAHSPRPRNSQTAQALGLADKFVVMFAGTMGRAQALGAVLDAARIVARSAGDVLFAFVGGGVETDRLKATAADSARLISNVVFLPRQPMSAMGDVLACADVLLVHLKDDPLFRITIPSKTQAYMAVGKPILMGVEGNAADLVRQADAGLCCRPENPEDIAQAVLQLRNKSDAERLGMGANGRQFYEKALSFNTGVTVFEDIFSSLIRPDHP